MSHAFRLQWALLYNTQALKKSIGDAVTSVGYRRNSSIEGQSTHSTTSSWAAAIMAAAATIANSTVVVGNAIAKRHEGEGSL